MLSSRSSWPSITCGGHEQHPQRRLGDDELERLGCVVENFLPPHPRRDGPRSISVGAVAAGPLCEDPVARVARPSGAGPASIRISALRMRFASRVRPVEVVLDGGVPAPELVPPPAVDGLRLGEQVEQVGAASGWPHACRPAADVVRARHLLAVLELGDLASAASRGRPASCSPVSPASLRMRVKALREAAGLVQPFICRLHSFPSGQAAANSSAGVALRTARSRHLRCRAMTSGSVMSALPSISPVVGEPHD